MRFAGVLAAIGLLLCAPPARAQGGWMGGDVEAPDKLGDAAFAAASVTIPGRISGDAMVMAGEAKLEGEVGDDARIAAGKYRQTGAVGGELAVAGQYVDIDGPVGDDLYVAGDDVRLGQDSRVGQDARIFGQDVLIKGRIDGNLDVSGEYVALAAQVGGDVTINARTLVLAPGATIEGRLIWRSPNQPDIPPDAIIHGGVEGEIVKPWRREGVWSWATPWRGAPRAAFYAGEAAGRLMTALSAFVIGLIVVLLLPHYADRVFAAVRDRWPAAAGWGAGALLLTPILAVIVMLTIVGIPLGLLMLLSMPIMALFGYALGAGALGALAVKATTPGGRMLALAIGLGALTLLSFVPGFSWLFGLLATVFGLGGLLLALRPRLTI